MYTYVCLHAISERNSKKKLIVIFVMVNYIKKCNHIFRSYNVSYNKRNNEPFARILHHKKYIIKGSETKFSL